MVNTESLRQKPPERWLNLAYLANGGVIKESLGLTKNQMNTIYKVGYGHYYSSRYQDALIIFRYLSLLDHRCHAYLLGLGSTLKSMQKYEQALSVLSCAEQADKNDPRATVCKAACFIELKDAQSAAILLSEAEKKAGKDRKWSELRQQIQKLKYFTGK